MKLHSRAYQIARVLNNTNAVLHPKRLPRRLKNIVIGRLLGRSGIWR
jgi:hypothetical protein